MTINGQVMPSLLQTMRAENAKCEKHGEYERIINFMGIPSRCPRCVEEREREISLMFQAEILEQERENRNRLLQFCRIEPEHYSATLENYAPRNESQQRALEMVKALVAEYKERSEEYVSPRYSKLIISGHNGLGKTHLAAAAVKALRGQIWTMYEISARIRASYSTKSSETELDIVEGLIRLPLLVIDEIGRTKGGNTETNWLSVIIDKRHSRGLPIMLLTNLSLKNDSKQDCPCLEDYVDTDIISRFRDGGSRITLTGEDYRTTLGNQKKARQYKEN
jgi:DNA replication protein DnaC